MAVDAIRDDLQLVTILDRHWLEPCLDWPSYVTQIRHRLVTYKLRSKKANVHRYENRRYER